MKKPLSDFIKSTIDNRGKNPTNYYEKEKYPVMDNVLIKNTLYPDMSLVNRFIDQETYDNFLRGYVHKNMPLITLVGNGIGNVTLAPANNVAIIQNTIGLEVEDTLDEVFLYYLLLYMQPIIRNFNRGSGQPSVKKTDLLKMEVDVPAIDVQKQIRSVLMSIDEKIENNKAINRNLWEQIDTYFYRLYSALETMDVLFGDVIERCVSRVKNERVKVLSPTSTGEVVLSEEYFTKQVFSKDISKYLKVEPHEFCYNPARANIGSIGINDFDFIGCVSPVYIVFKTEENLIYYVSRYFRTEQFKTEVIVRSSGSVRQALRYEDLMQIKFRKPSSIQLTEFNSFYSVVKKKIDFLNNENRRLSEIRDSLLPKLMSGELDVSDLDI